RLPSNQDNDDRRLPRRRSRRVGSKTMDQERPDLDPCGTQSPRTTNSGSTGRWNMGSGQRMEEGQESSSPRFSSSIKVSHTRVAELCWDPQKRTYLRNLREQG